MSVKLVIFSLCLCIASFVHAQVVAGGNIPLVGGTSSLSGTSPTVVSLVVTPPAASQVVNTSLGYSATATLSNGLLTSVTKLSNWTTSNSAIATVGTLTNTQAINCVSAGTAQITAQYGTVTGSTTLTCTSAVPPAPTLVSIAASPASPSIAVGALQGFTATGTYSDGSTQDVTATVVWTSNDNTLAIPFSLTATENVKCLKAGSPIITATSGSLHGNQTLTCNAVLTSITVTPASPSTNVGTSQNFIATCNYNDGSSADCTIPSTWTSGTTSVATIAAKADPQPVNCLNVPTSVITATIGTVSGTSTLTCLAVGPPPPVLVSLAITPASPTINKGSSIGFIATCTYSDGSTQDCTVTANWTTSNPAVASLGHAFLNADDAIAGWALCYISQTPPCSPGGTKAPTGTPTIALVASPSLDGQSMQFQMVVPSGSGSTNVLWDRQFGPFNNVTKYVRDFQIYIPSPLPNQAEFDLGNFNKGKGVTFMFGTQCDYAGGFWDVWAQGGSTPGWVTTTAPCTSSVLTANTWHHIVQTDHSVGNNMVFDSLTLDGATQFSNLTEPSGTLPSTYPTGTIFVQNQLNATTAGTYTEYLDEDSFYVSGDDPQLVNGLSNGTSTIQAAIGAISGSTVLTVQTPAPTLSSIAVTPASPTQTVGSVVGFTATCTYSDSSTQNCTSSATWTSSSTSVATIGVAASPQTALCVTVGSSTIKAAVGATNGTTTLTCKAVVPPTSSIDQYCGPGNTPSFGANDSYALLPQTCYYTDPSARPATGTVRVATAATWTSVWALTNCDDVVEIAAGTTITGSFVIPSKVCAAGHYRTLRVTGFASNFPAYGGIRKVSPHLWGVASLPGYPSFGSSPVVNVGATIQSTGTGIPITLTSPTSGLQIEGIQITRTAGTGYIARMIKVEAAGFDHIIFDSDWVAGTPLDETQRVLIMDGISYFAFINGLATDLHCISGGACAANQAFSGGFSTLSSTQDHTWKIVNNYITSADNTTIGLGGGAANTTPADIEFRLNWGQKLQIWNPSSPTYSTAPKMFVVKQSLESKNSDRFFVEGNVFDGVWAGFSQVGSHILFTPKNQAINGASVCPNCSVTNFTVRYNFFTTSNNCFQIANAAGDAGGYATAGNSYSIHDNVCENTNYATCYKCATNSGGALDGGFLSATAATAPASFVLSNVLVNHNDYIPAAGAFTMGGTLGISGPASPTKMSNYSWTNNLILKEPTNNAGANPINNPSDGCSQAGNNNCYCGAVTPAQVMNQCFATYTFGGNALVNGGGKTWPGANCLSETSLANIFVSYNGGFNGPTNVTNYLLKTTSLCHNSGLDGRDPGADIPTLANRIQGVAQF